MFSRSTFSRSTFPRSTFPRHAVSIGPGNLFMSHTTLVPMTPTEQFRYDHWANTQWLEWLREGPAMPDARERLAHIAATGHVWHRRVLGAGSPDVEIWPDLSLDACARLLDRTHDDWVQYLEPLPDDALDRPVSYRNSRGTGYTQPLHQILLHLITHNHYHRGQIAQLVRQDGRDPIWTDVMAYARREE